MIQTKNLLLTAVATAAFLACSEDTILIEKTTVDVGATGGAIKSADGRAELTIAAGALSETMPLWVNISRPDRTGLKSALYEFGPSGTVFATAATLKIRIPEGEDVVIAFADGERPVPLHDSRRDGEFVQGSLRHFSSYGCFQHGGACNHDADCLMGEVCGMDGHCFTPHTGCTTDAECGMGEVCANGACTVVNNNTPSCQADSDCDQDEICDVMLLLCVPINTPTACMSDQDCPMGACVNGACDYNHNNAPCNTDLDCPQGTACDAMQGACVVHDPSTPCQVDQDCPNGQSCDAMSFTCVDDNTQQCNTDADCGMGGVCSNGICLHNDPFCQADSDCAQGEVCQNGVCSQHNNGTPCQVDSDCAQGEICDPMSFVCIAGNTHTSCQVDSDCAQGEVCDPQAFICVGANTPTACMSDQDCPMGQHCDANTNTCS
jgi:Cys-rich repeat protein